MNLLQIDAEDMQLLPNQAVCSTMSKEDVQLLISSARCYHALPTLDLDAAYAPLSFFPFVPGL